MGVESRLPFILGSVVVSLFVACAAWWITRRKRVLADLVAQQPGPISHEKPARLRILSHNVWGHYFVGGLRLSQRLDALAKHIESSRVDVVCVQELFLLQAGPFVHAEYFIRFAERMRALGLVYTVDPLVNMRPFLQNSGLAIFSRFPFERSSHVPFAQSAEPLSSKGIMTAVLRVGDSTWHILNTHLDSRNTETRRWQAQAVASAAAELVAGSVDARLVAMGDFNIDARNGDLYGGLCRHLAAAGAEIDLFRGPDTSVSTCVGWASWIDHAFVSRTAASHQLRRAVVELRVDGSGTSFEGSGGGEPFDSAFCDGEPHVAESEAESRDIDELLATAAADSKGHSAHGNDGVSALPSALPCCSSASGARAVSDHRGLLMEFAV